MTQPEPVQVSLSEKSDLWTMFQLYAAELAPFANLKPVDGIVSYAPFDLYWQEDRHWPFWAVMDRVRVGFALVRFAPEHNAMQMAEFYIPPGHRRCGAGLSFARSLLALYPGSWKIRQMAANKVAIAFWHRVVELHAYNETSFADKGIGRIEQTLTVG